MYQRCTLDNAYSILELKRPATEEQVKKAYKRLARIYHPDKNTSPNACEQFNNIHNAYMLVLVDTIHDPKDEYDLWELFKEIIDGQDFNDREKSELERIFSDNLESNDLINNLMIFIYEYTTRKLSHNNPLLAWTFHNISSFLLE